MSRVTLKIKSGLILLAACLAVFACMELGARVYLTVISGMDTDGLLYGWNETHLVMHGPASADFAEADKNIDLRPDATHQDWDATGKDLSGTPRSEFEQRCGGMVHFSLYGHEVIAKELMDTDLLHGYVAESEAKGRPLSVWTFGGSTTKGFNFSKDASSWPAELEKLAPQALRITNYGANGFSSDQSIDRLAARLEDQPAPDVVLWANWVNEQDVLYFTMDRNFDRLRALFPQLDQPKLVEKLRRSNARKYFFRSLSMSLERHLALYRLMLEAANGLRPASQPAQAPDAPKEITNLGQLFDDGGIALTVANYRINFEELLELSRQYGFQVAVIRLPVSWRGALWENEKRDFRWGWAKGFNPATDKLCKENSVPLVDLQRILFDKHYFSMPQTP